MREIFGKTRLKSLQIRSLSKYLYLNTVIKRRVRTNINFYYVYIINVNCTRGSIREQTREVIRLKTFRCRENDRGILFVVGSVYYNDKATAGKCDEFKRRYYVFFRIHNAHRYPVCVSICILLWKPRQICTQ